MFKDAIKTWQFKGRKRCEHIGLFKKSVHVIYSNRPDDCIIYSHEEFLLSREVFGSQEIHFEICKEIVAVTDTSELFPSALKVFQFYKTYQPNEGLSETVDIPETNFSVLFSPMGLMQFRNLQLEQVCIKTQNIHDFFFYGPNFSGIPLKNRIIWREELLKMLGKNSYLSKKDSFVLIDYDKIKEYSQSSPDPLRDAGTYVNFNKTGLTIGDYNSNQESSSKYSVEECWYFGDKLLDNWVIDVYLEIKKIISSAILIE